MTVSGVYLDQMFGDVRGYVYVAHKGKDESWQERHFSWPEDKRRILGWAQVHKDANLFIVPALRNTATRRKGDGINLRWLWADVDFDKIPATKVDLVNKRIAQLGSYVVRSGSGNNAHVYVKLKAPIGVAEHYRLNTGLRDYLYADNKQADNSFLRLPGTTNWKTPSGSPVRADGGHGRVFTPASFARLGAFQRAARGVARTAAKSWTPVDVSQVSGRARRAASMMTDEACARYGSRHRAVWAVVGDLVRWGLTPDEIHTLMDEFPPAVEKTDEEHGAYDVHKDVERRLATQAHAQAIVDGVDEHDHGSDDSPFEDLSDEELRAMGPSNPMVRKILDRRAAQREADHIEATRRFMAPPPDVSWSAGDALADPPAPQPHLIEGVAGVKHNVVITAQYKTGKTAFTIATLAKSLCDGTKFMGTMAVPTDGRVVGHWNCEMEGTELLDDYIRPAQFKHADRLHVANLRGYAVNVLTPVGKAWTVEWLRSRGVQVWTIDSLARLLRMAGVSEKENDEVLNVLMAIDEIKVEAGVDVCFVIAHTGRAEMAEGSERARGATVIDDWADARWIMTKDGDGDGPRFLAVEGRGVRLRTTAIDFNRDTKVSTLGVGNKADVRADGVVQAVVEIVRANRGIAKDALVKLVSSRLGVRNRTTVREHISEAVETGWIEVRSHTRSGGGRASQLHYVVERSGSAGATPRAVDFRRERVRK